MRDIDVRNALHRKVLREHHDDTKTLVIDELGLRHGSCRVDVAVVNGILHGYEIKSDADTLKRLPLQIVTYSAVLDKATLVVGEKHADKSLSIIPQWWGVKIVSKGSRGGINFSHNRMPQMNPSVDPVAIAELLWKDEAIYILRKIGTPEGYLRKPRAFLYRHLAEVLQVKDLRDSVRHALKLRVNWRGQRPPLLDDGS